jgi:NADH pyrophosphatase NudC (nudix superfamily)
MAKNRKSTPEVDSVRPYLEGVAKNLADRIWGSNGPAWGTKLTQIEDLVVEIREILSEKMLELGLERQAAMPAEQRPPDFQICPGCGKPPKPREAEPRLLKTRGGEAQWQEPQQYCPQCRQAFFPSVQEFGD